MGCHCTVKPCEHPLVCNSCGVFFADETRKRRDNPERAVITLEHGHKGSGYKPHCGACSAHRYQSCLEVGMNPELVGLRKQKGGSGGAAGGAASSASAAAAASSPKLSSSPKRAHMNTLAGSKSPLSARRADTEMEMDDEEVEEPADTPYMLPLRARRAAPAPLRLHRQPSSSDLQVLATVCSEMSQCTPLTPISQLTRAAEFCDASPWSRTALSH